MFLFVGASTSIVCKCCNFSHLCQYFFLFLFNSLAFLLLANLFFSSSPFSGLDIFFGSVSVWVCVCMFAFRKRRFGGWRKPINKRNKRMATHRRRGIKGKRGFLVSVALVGCVCLCVFSFAVAIIVCYWLWSRLTVLGCLLTLFYL